MSPSLTDRVRALLPAGHAVRMAPMFGGVSVMVDEKMLVSIRKDDDLLVRIDPARRAELLAVEGAAPAVMGVDRRPMGQGWIVVSGAAVASAEQLGFWVQVALDHRPASTG